VVRAVYEALSQMVALMRLADGLSGKIDAACVEGLLNGFRAAITRRLGTFWGVALGSYGA